MQADKSFCLRSPSVGGTRPAPATIRCAFFCFQPEAELLSCILPTLRLCVAGYYPWTEQEVKRVGQHASEADFREEVVLNSFERRAVNPPFVCMVVTLRHNGFFIPIFTSSGLADPTSRMEYELLGIMTHCGIFMLKLDQSTFLLSFLCSVQKR